MLSQFYLLSDLTLLIFISTVMCIHKLSNLPVFAFLFVSQKTKIGF